MCLLHEADFIEVGAEGWGITSIEHVEPQSTAAGKKLVNSYTNLLYVCRFCNSARGDQPRTDGNGRRLLVPTEVAWATHFQIKSDHIIPIPGDPDAEYTWHAYDLGDPRKAVMRQKRREHIMLCLQYIAELPPTIAAMTALEANLRGQPTILREDLDAVRDTIKQLRFDLAWAKRGLLRYIAIPTDANDACRCTALDRKLPRGIAEQLIPYPNNYVSGKS